MSELALEKPATALVVIDLQKGVAGMPTEPYSAKTVVANAARLADAFRKNRMSVFLVRVTPSADGKDGLKPIADNALPVESAPPRRLGGHRAGARPRAGRSGHHEAPMGRFPWNGARPAVAPEGHPHHRPMRHFDQHRRRKHRPVPPKRPATSRSLPKTPRLPDPGRSTNTP